jgi:hypothetical protein
MRIESAARVWPVAGWRAGVSGGPVMDLHVEGEEVDVAHLQQLQPGAQRAARYALDTRLCTRPRGG